MAESDPRRERTGAEEGVLAAIIFFLDGAGGWRWGPLVVAKEVVFPPTPNRVDHSFRIDVTVTNRDK